MKYRLITCLMLLLHQTCLARATDSQDLEASYAGLKKIAQTTISSGMDKQALSELKRIRQGFFDHPEDGASFLRLKLEAINVTEMKYFSGTRRFEDIVKYLDEQKSVSLVKKLITFVLAELYPHVSPTSQGQILTALKESFTPIFSLKEDLLSLQWALLHIGPDSVPTLLEVAQNPEQTIRCNVQEGLNSLAIGIAKGAPVLNCKDSPELAEQKISSWQQWWFGVGSKRPFKRVPSPFETLEESSNFAKP